MWPAVVRLAVEIALHPLRRNPPQGFRIVQGLELVPPRTAQLAGTHGSQGEEAQRKARHRAGVILFGIANHLSELLDVGNRGRSEEHTSELQSLMRISYAVFCLKKKKKQNTK